MKYYLNNNNPDIKVHTDFIRILYLVGTIRSPVRPHPLLLKLTKHIHEK